MSKLEVQVLLGHNRLSSKFSLISVGENASMVKYGCAKAVT